MIEGIGKTFGDSDLPRHVVIEAGRFVDVHGMADEIWGPDRPADLPACAIEHLAGRVDCDGLFEIARAVVCKAHVLASIEWEEIVDIIGEHSDLRMPV